MFQRCPTHVEGHDGMSARFLSILISVGKEGKAGLRWIFFVTTVSGSPVAMYWLPAGSNDINVLEASMIMRLREEDEMTFGDHLFAGRAHFRSVFLLIDDTLRAAQLPDAIKRLALHLK